MPSENYCSSFMHHVSDGGDAHQCWQEDGFWPNRIDAELEHIHIWGCELALSYCNSGDIIQFLTFISGRTLPEMLKGFETLDCPTCALFCRSLINKFGPTYPRNDSTRGEFVQSNVEIFENLDKPLWDAHEEDQFDLKSRVYYKTYCIDRGIPPWGPDYHPSRRGG